MNSPELPILLLHSSLFIVNPEGVVYGSQLGDFWVVAAGLIGMCVGGQL